MDDEIVLREFYDKKLDVFIRYKQNLSGETYFTVQGEIPQRAKSLEKPIYVHIRATDKCNLNCPYCYTKDNSDKNDMSDEEMLEILKLCNQKEVLGITWTGGEPFMRKNMVSLINAVHDMKINQTVLTNGTLLKDEILESIPNDNVLIQISLNEAWNSRNLYRNESILKNAENAIKKGKKVVITVILEPVNLSDYEELINNLLYHSISNVRFGFEIPVGGLSHKDMVQYIEDMKKLIPDLQMLKEKYSDDILISYQFDKYCIDEQIIPKRFFSCEAGTTQIYIDNNGDVYPCPLFKSYEEFYCGNVFKNTWEELWKADPMEKFRNISICKNCNVTCTDWCRALLYPVTGSLKGKSLFCMK